MSFGWKHDATRCKQLDLTCSFSQLLSRSLAHIINSVGNHGHDRKRAYVTTRVDKLIGSTKICTSTGLGQRFSRIEESWPDDRPLRQQSSDRVVCAAGLSNRRKPVQKTVSQIIRSGQRNFSCRIRNIPWTQGESRDMGVGIDKPWHKCLAEDINNRCTRGVDGCRGYRVDVVVFDNYIETLLQRCKSVEYDVGVSKMYIGHFPLSPISPDRPYAAV